MRSRQPACWLGFESKAVKMLTEAQAVPLTSVNVGGLQKTHLASDGNAGTLSIQRRFAWPLLVVCSRLADEKQKLLRYRSKTRTRCVFCLAMP